MPLGLCGDDARRYRRVLATREYHPAYSALMDLIARSQQYGQRRNGPAEKARTAPIESRTRSPAP